MTTRSICMALPPICASKQPLRSRGNCAEQRARLVLLVRAAQLARWCC
jgi:hypothetical protein